MNTPNMIIGLIGFKQVGKSTAAKYLEERYGYKRINMKDALVAEIKRNFRSLLIEIAWAENARKFFLIYDGEPEDSYIDRLFVEKPPAMRALLQCYGTEVRRGDKDSYWTEQWQSKVYKELEMVDGKLQGNIVVDDVRFLNEAKAVKDVGGILIRLVRPDITSGGDHKSETEQLSIEADYTLICQPGAPQGLFSQLDDIVGPNSL